MRRLLLLAAMIACRSSSPPSGETKSASPGSAAAPTVSLEVGSPAPAFSLPGSDGKTHALADDLGKRVVVLAWYPKAFTGG